MSASCSTPVSWEDLVAYWAHDLDQTETDRIDEHLIGCDLCTAASARVAAVTEGVRAMIPAFVSTELVERLRARGLRIVENPVVPSEEKPALFARGVDVLLHRLGGIDLTRAASVAVTVSNEDTGEVLMVDPHVPFDRTTGEVLVACQRHFGEYSRTVVFEVRARDQAGATQVSRFAIPHVFEAQP